MKRYFFIALLVGMVCVTSAFGEEGAKDFEFLTPYQVEKIKKERAKKFSKELVHNVITYVAIANVIYWLYRIITKGAAPLSTDREGSKNNPTDIKTTHRIDASASPEAETKKG